MNPIIIIFTFCNETLSHLDPAITLLPMYGDSAASVITYYSSSIEGAYETYWRLVFSCIIEHDRMPEPEFDEESEVWVVSIEQ